MKEPLRIPRSFLSTAEAARRPGFAAAVLALAREEGDWVILPLCDWHDLTRIYSPLPGRPVTPSANRPCCQ